MGNHFHLLCQTPEMNLDQVMHSLLRSSSLVIHNEASEKGPLWSRYKWSLICAPVH
jgi:REP element-mobilizing transposase RayT